MRYMVMFLFAVSGCGSSVDDKCEKICENAAACGSLDPLLANDCKQGCIDLSDKCPKSTDDVAGCIDGKSCDQSQCATEVSALSECWDSNG